MTVIGLVVMKDTVKRYGARISVDHLNLTIREGEIFGLLGPNGAGKSTTIQMIAGLLRPDAGEVFVDGISAVYSPLEAKRRIGLVPQEIAVYEMLSAQENVELFARLYGMRGREVARGADESLAFVGLSERRKERPASFSGGMKRRLNIACAIAHRPKLLIMDEPTVGIDPQSRRYILDSIKELNRRGTTVIYTSHYMEEVEAISTRIGIMDNGRLIACGTQAELRAMVETEEKLLVEVAEMNPAAIAELQNHPRIKSVRVEGATIELAVQSLQAYLQDVLFILSKHELVVRSLNRIEPNLESLFLALTGRKLRE